jgi:hypothetical protein
MKHLHGMASASVGAPAEDCISLLAAIEDYPLWYPEVVRSVEVLDRADGGLVERAAAVLFVSHGPIRRDFHLELAVAVDGNTVRISRIPDPGRGGETFDVRWEIDDRAGTVIEVTLEADIAVPRLVPVGGVGESFAAGFVRAAAGRLS